MWSCALQAVAVEEWAASFDGHRLDLEIARNSPGAPRWVTTT
jgi:hypothetical protein